MKENDMNAIDELRPEYQRSDFGKLERGKYASQLLEEINFIVLETDATRTSQSKKINNLEGCNCSVSPIVKIRR